MLFVLAIAGQDRSRLATQLTGPLLSRTVDVPEADAKSLSAKTRSGGRSPASAAPALDIEPVLPGGE